MQQAPRRSRQWERTGSVVSGLRPKYVLDCDGTSAWMCFSDDAAAGVNTPDAGLLVGVASSATQARHSSDTSASLRGGKHAPFGTALSAPEAGETESGVDAAAVGEAAQPYANRPEPCCFEAVAGPPGPAAAKVGAAMGAGAVAVGDGDARAEPHTTGDAASGEGPVVDLAEARAGAGAAAVEDAHSDAGFAAAVPLGELLPDAPTTGDLFPDVPAEAAQMEVVAEGALVAATAGAPPTAAAANAGVTTEYAVTAPDQPDGSMERFSGNVSQPASQSATVHAAGLPDVDGGKMSASLSKEDLSERGTSTRQGTMPRLHGNSRE